MEVRLSDVLAAHYGLVKDKAARVVRVVLDDADQHELDRLPAGYRRFAPQRMATGVWLRVHKGKGLPLSTHIAEAIADDAAASSMIFLEIHSAEFHCELTIEKVRLPTHVIRWQFPLTHAKIRTAFSAQGMTLEGGVIVDLRRAGGLQDDDWWLATYMMLSRARKLKNLILIGFTEQVEDLLRRGPPQHLLTLMADLEQRATATLARL